MCRGKSASGSGQARRQRLRGLNRKKAQKAQNGCGFCAFLWLFFRPSFSIHRIRVCNRVHEDLFASG
jgi:hypothetical protein